MRRRTGVARVVIGMAIGMVLWAGVQLVRPASAVAIQQTLPASLQVPGKSVAIAWPERGQAALEVAGIGTMAVHGAQSPVPIASVAKLMTAHLVLQDHPIVASQDGPIRTITAEDAQEYEHDLATGQSCVKVVAGEKLTERQLLEALLLPSANNAADILAQWDAGSVSAFVAKMNAAAQALGMNHTHYADASGYRPATVSTAVDQLKIAEADMADPAFAGMVAMKQVTLPVAGTQYNVDYALGHNGMIGIKTGSTAEAGGCFVFATRPVVAGRHVLLIGAVLGQQPTKTNGSELMEALRQGESLSAQANGLLHGYRPVTAGEAVATLSTAWGQSAAAVSAHDVSLIGWPGMPITVKLHAAKAGPTFAAGQPAGTLQVQAGCEVIEVPVHAAEPIGRPSLAWKLERIR